MPTFDLKKLFSSARHAQGSMPHVAAGFDMPHAVTTKPAASSLSLDLRELDLPTLQNADGIVTHAPAGEPAAKSTRVPAAVVASSLVAQAGAHIIVAAERPMPSGNELATYRDAGALVVADPATFTAVADGQNVATSPLPIHSAAISWPTAPSIAFSTNITRHQLKHVGFDIESAIVRAIVLGLARAADAVLLKSIAESAPGGFTLSDAAARGLQFAELRALIGTAAKGAAVSEDGTLRAAGVRGELTPTVADTLIGAFSRAGVAIHPSIAIHAKRTSVAGNLELTCFANVLALLPDASAFWKAV